MESIFEQLEKKTIAPQYFRIAITSGILSKVFSYVCQYTHDKTLITYIAGMVSGFVLLIHLK